MTAEVYETKPQGFKAAMEIAACYLEIDGQLLLLECASSKSEPGKWGVPAGKLEIGETPEQAAKRELFEETGILAESSDIHAIGSLYIRKPDIDYVYHLFQITLKAKPEVRLSSEHTNHLWAIQQEIETLPLMAGALGALQKYRSSLTQKKRITASVNVYLILQKGDQILLQLRQNTGYLDHHWSLAAGHVEQGTYHMVQEAPVKPPCDMKKALANGVIVDLLILDELKVCLQYFHVSELKDLCNQLKIPANEKKPGLINQILSFIQTGVTIHRCEYPTASKALRGINYPMTPEALMLDGAFKNDAKTRKFFKMLIGAHFHYTVFGLDWLKERWQQGSPPTYQEFADFWQSEYLARKDQRNALKEEWAYLNFARQFADQNPHASKKTLLIEWKKVRIRQVQNAKKILEKIGHQ